VIVGLAEVFLSHNHQDKPWVRSLYEALRERGVTDVFLDEYAIDAGERFVPALERGLGNTLMFILIWSAGAANSRWVAVERELALLNHAEGTTLRLVPIRLDGTPLPGFLQLFNCLTAQEPFPTLADRLVRALAGARKERAGH
jgi:hypothetical protein